MVVNKQLRSIIVELLKAKTKILTINSINYETKYTQIIIARIASGNAATGGERIRLYGRWAVL